ncbi:MAG: preprotein translocase subunit SecE [Caldiserica bacterium]|nr:preprotein translocase subunit SecE [Caldisericota bacterium]MCX6097043.1 preprotein translocase subunit SecE [Caldisericota bacterium]
MSNTKTVKPTGVRFKNWIRSMWTEIRHRVTWPRPRELMKSGVTIITFVAFWAIYIGAWDYLFAAALKWLISA